MRTLILKTKNIMKDKYTLNIFANTGWLFFDRIFRMGMGVIVGIQVARFLGPSDFGSYNYALAFITLFLSLITLGLDSIVVRDVSRNSRLANDILGSALILRIVSSIITVILINLFIYLSDFNTIEIKVLISIFSIMMLFQVFDTIDLWFQTQLLSKLTVISKGIAFLFSTILKIVFLLLDMKVYWFALTNTLEVLIGAIILIVNYKLSGNNIFSWTPSFSTMKRLLKESWPLIFSGFAIALYMKIDQVMLGIYKGSYEVGIYSAATRLSEVWYFIPTAIVASVAPKIAQLKNGDFNSYNTSVQKLFDVVVLLGFLIAIPMTVLSKYLILFLYGNEYAEAGGILAIQIWAAIFIFLGVAKNPWIINEGLAKVSLYSTLTGALINIIGNMLLIPKFGAYGSTYMTIFSQFIAAFLFFGIPKKTRPVFIMMLRSVLLINHIKFLIKMRKGLKRKWAKN